MVKIYWKTSVIRAYLLVNENRSYRLPIICHSTANHQKGLKKTTVNWLSFSMSHWTQNIRSFQRLSFRPISSLTVSTDEVTDLPSLVGYFVYQHSTGLLKHYKCSQNFLKEPASTVNTKTEIKHGQPVNSFLQVKNVS